VKIFAPTTYCRDPRSDLTGDTRAWLALLQKAYLRQGIDPHDPDSLFGVLLGFRSMGARLALVGEQLRIVSGEIPPAAYAEWRETYLRPHAEFLTDIMGFVEKTLQRSGIDISLEDTQP
jgi:hypothetical protein